MMDSLNFQVRRTSDPSRDYLTRMWTREAGGVDTSDINLSPGFLLPEKFCLIYRWPPLVVHGALQVALFSEPARVIWVGQMPTMLTIPVECVSQTCDPSHFFFGQVKSLFVSSRKIKRLQTDTKLDYWIVNSISSLLSFMSCDALAWCLAKFSTRAPHFNRRLTRRNIVAASLVAFVVSM